MYRISFFYTFRAFIFYRYFFLVILFVLCYTYYYQWEVVVHVLSILTSRGHLSRGSVIIGQASKRDQGGKKRRAQHAPKKAPKVLVLFSSFHSPPPPLLLLLLLCCCLLFFSVMIFERLHSLAVCLLFHTIAVADPLSCLYTAALNSLSSAIDSR